MKHQIEDTYISKLADKYPARIDYNQAGKILGFSEDEIKILVQNNHLKPIGKPRQNARKFFTLVETGAKTFDPEWIRKATDTVYKHWNEKNSKKLLNNRNMN